MPRAEQGVAADLNRLGCRMNQKMLAALAQELVADESILDALGTHSEGAVYAVVLTRQRILGVKFNPRSWLGEDEHLHVTPLPWREVGDVYAGDQYGDKKVYVISVSGHSSTSNIELSFQQGRVDEQRRDMLVQRIQEMAAAVKSAPAPQTSTVPAVRPPAETWISELERLANLRQSGALTQEEFELSKRKLLE